MIYLDFAATTPISETALEAYVKYAKSHFGNSKSLHDFGGDAEQLLNHCREILAKLINGDHEGIYFTSGGSESNILAIQSLLNGTEQAKKHIVTSTIEHSSIHNFLKNLQNNGYTVSFVRPDKHGRITINSLEKMIRNDTALVSIQHGNSEIGIIQNIEEIGSFLKEKAILFHSDCVQTFAKVPIDVEKMKIDALSFSSHKIYGPKGVGAVYIDPSVYWVPIIEGTTHEKGFRPGTINTPGIASFTIAAKSLHDEMKALQSQFTKLRKLFIELIAKEQLPIEVLGTPQSEQLPAIIGCIFKGIEGQYIMLECNRKGIAISTGSACQAGMQEPSRTVISLDRTKEEAAQYIRVSLGIGTTEEDILQLVEAFSQIREEYH
ncbi:IscS subfamily cysteine desulfurase [Metabacillus arenae]|uniref:IscS subfamily cysteine desulfurase n=1 Tax=Metabacillus arenae TaxID=2771434 RepID=A0A926RY01_9BACI|nr:IscS subfamily cysteine desulfurase [Metabacillus arenae]MBD1381215.1 IscS subfamily cysteine desulfurase [Metabacillus arenae]